MLGNLRFINDEYNRKYFRDGFLTAPFLKPEEIDLINNVFHRHFHFANMPSIYDTIAETPPETIEAVNLELNAICETILKKLLINYRIVGSIFFIKKPGEDTYKEFHIDPSMTKEGYNNIGIWIPLCDIDEQTGRMCLLKHSHQFLPPYYSTSMPYPYREVEHIIAPHVICFTQHAGEALFFNNSMLHCTQKNTSGKIRIAVIIKLIDENAPLVTPYYDAEEEPDKQVSIYQHNYDFFVKCNFRNASPPEQSKFLGYLPGLPKIFNEAEIKRLIEEHIE